MHSGNWAQALVVAALLVGSYAHGQDERDMQAQLQELRQRLAAQEQQSAQQQAEIAALRQQLGQDWLKQRDAEQVREVVEQVIADADAKTAQVDPNLTAGWNNGFFIGADDGPYQLRIFGQLQARYLYSHSDNAFDGSIADAPATPADERELDDSHGGFEISRVRLGFKGHVIDPTWQYFVWGGYNSSGGGTLLDLYIRKEVGEGWSLTAGQFKVPLWQEWVFSETRQAFVERSLVSQQFAGAYTQGLVVGYKPGPLNFMLSANDGVGMTNTAWNSAGSETPAVTGRAEWLVFGDWGQYNEFESWPGSKPSLVLGGAGHYQEGEYGTDGTTLATGDEARQVRWSGDALLKLSGVHLFGAVLGNHLTEAQNVPDLNQYGAVAQAGWFVAPDIELIGRYEWGTLDVEGVDDLSLVTVGFNKFFAKHQIKWTTDAGYSFNALNRAAVGGNAFGWATDSTGWRSDADGEDGQFVVRSQLQLLF